jgi:HEPN domain-containing protein
MVERSKDWLDQAERDLKQTEASLRDGFYEWACFAAQQAAVKAVKALIQSLGGEALGHSVAALIQALPENVRPNHLRDQALELDQAYIPSRYPNAHPAGFPGVAYTRKMGRG